MAWTIPNAQSANYAEQARVYASALMDLVLARQGTGVISGCQVSLSNGSTRTLSITSGSIQFLGTQPVNVSGGTISLNSADTTKRIDIIYADNTGTIGKVTGTPNATDPVEPDLPANSVKLAAIFMQANVNTLSSAMILDRRVQVVRPYSVYEYAVATGQYNGSEAGFLDSLKGSAGPTGPAGSGVLILNAGEAIPANTPNGTKILRRY